jgi:hypothetical protein
VTLLYFPSFRPCLSFSSRIGMSRDLVCWPRGWVRQGRSPLTKAPKDLTDKPGCQRDNLKYMESFLGSVSYLCNPRNSAHQSTLKCPGDNVDQDYSDVTCKFFSSFSPWGILVLWWRFSSSLDTRHLAGF